MTKSDEPARYGTQIRVSTEFARAIGDAAHMERLSIAGFANSFLLPIVESMYREAIIREARRIEGDAK